MTKYLCIHGHFYQPPRFDPWLEEVLPEGSAAPDHDWNARISKECYAPLSRARRLDASGRILELINCYAWISFNFGPTLLTWMQRQTPASYSRILKADQESLARLGHGNALAQVYHHAIMPLAADLDKKLEIRWAIQDFQARYGRKPEGMWLAEAAVDLPTLSALVKHNIAFTLLAPRQAKAVRPVSGGEFQPMDAQSLDTTMPYLVRLPGGQSITVFFYQGETSQAVAFERLLQSGENFWARLLAGHVGGLRHIATDGESYGHHFPFGEMALAYVIAQAREQRDRVALTNYAAFLADAPPTHEVLIHENSSWSCAHGVERWKTHCGCSDGGHPGWIQDWRRPLRRSLNYLKYYVDEHYRKAGKRLFADPTHALEEYGLVLAESLSLDEFLAMHLAPGCTLAERQNACRLLVMQKQALASFSSCGWFFDDIARIEPINNLSAARRALDLLRASGGPDVEEGFVRILAEAQSNMNDDLDGAAIWNTMVTPRRPTLPELSQYGLLQRPVRQKMSWPGLELEITGNGPEYVARATWTRTLETEEVSFQTMTLSPVSRHRAEIAYYLAQENELELLGYSCDLAKNFAPLLADFTESQVRPQASLTMLVPGLVWNWLMGEQGLSDDICSYLAGYLEKSDLARMLAELAEARGLILVQNLPENVPALTTLIRRSRQLRLPAYWWRVQNRVMDAPDHCRYLELCQILGLATD